MAHRAAKPLCLPKRYLLQKAEDLSLIAVRREISG